MKYKVTLNGRTYEVEVEAGKAMLVDEYEAYAPAPAAPAAPAAAPAAPPSNKHRFTCRISLDFMENPPSRAFSRPVCASSLRGRLSPSMVGPPPPSV